MVAEDNIAVAKIVFSEVTHALSPWANDQR